MSLQWKNRLAVLSGSVLAVLVGWHVANNSYGLPLLLVAGTAFVGSLAYLGLGVDLVALCGLLVGYVVGNRGFAQLTLLPGLPLFPAEAGLALALAGMVVRSALSRSVPWRRDALNAAILVWIAVAGARILPDMRQHGAMALRDFAVVYHALFFFVAQALAAEPRAKALLQRSLFLATLLAVPCFELFRRFPEFFLDRLTVAGVPLIYLKGDLIATFIAVGAVLTYARYDATRRPFWLLASLASVVVVLSSDNRASVVALLGATLCFVIARRWRWVGMLAGASAGAALLLLALAVFAFPQSSRPRPLAYVVDRVASIFDVSGRYQYTTENDYKADNNRFRLVWWRTVIDQTLEQGPLLGLGFGYDLAEEFTREYGADEEMTARSPHSILVTVFGRMGVIGFLAFLGLLIALAARTLAAVRAYETDGNAVLWIVAWVILISACFGVVLEGPMGAVVFWTVLGLANVPVEAKTDRIEIERVRPAEL